jgi:hypothetical protein
MLNWFKDEQAIKKSLLFKDKWAESLTPLSKEQRKYASGIKQQRDFDNIDSNRDLSQEINHKLRDPVVEKDRTKR